MSRNLASGGVTMIAAASVMIVALDVHTALTTPRQLRRTISEYGLGSVQWVFTIAVILLAAGSLAILLSIARRERGRLSKVGSIAMLLWSVGLVTVVAAPKQDWATDPVLGFSGAVHRFGSGVAFVSLPVAVILLTRRNGRARWAYRAGWVSTATLMPIAVALVVGLTTPTPWFRVIVLGYVERVVVVSEVIAVVLLGLWAARGCAGSLADEDGRLAIQATEHEAIE